MPPASPGSEQSRLCANHAISQVPVREPGVSSEAPTVLRKTKLNMRAFHRLPQGIDVCGLWKAPFAARVDNTHWA